MTSPTKHPAVLIFVLWLAGLGAAGQFAKIAVVFTDIQAHYPEAGVSFGFLLSMISVLGIVLGLVAGIVVARFGYRNLLLIALILGAVLSAYQSTLPSMPIMLASRLLEGLSHLLIVVAAPTLIAQIASDRWRGFAMTLWGSFFGVSFAIFAYLGLWLVDHAGIAALFLAHALALIVIAFALAVLLPSQRAFHSDEPPLNLRQILANHREVYASPNMAAAAIGWLLYTLTFVAFLTLLPGFVAKADQRLLASMMPLAGIITSLSLGVLLLRYFSAYRVVIIGFISSILVLAFIALWPGQHLLFVALLGALGLVQGASFALVPQLNSSDKTRALANGAMAQMGNLGNTLGTPLMLAIIPLAGFNGVLIWAACCYGLAVALHMFFAAKRQANPA